MIGALLARITGPRVLLGIALASVLAITFLWLRLDAAKSEAARAGQAEAQVRDALQTAEAQAAASRQDAERLQSILIERDKAVRRAQQQATAFSNALDDLRKSSVEVRHWADGSVPSVVLERLRHGATSGNDKGDSSGAAGGVDAAVRGS